VIDWLNDNSGAVQAIAVGVLAVVTAVYAVLRWLVAGAARRQADASGEMAREMHEQSLSMDRAYLLIEMENLGSLEWREINEGVQDLGGPYDAYPELVRCRVYNAGRGPAKEVCVTFVHPSMTYKIVPRDVLRSGDSTQVGIEALPTVAGWKREDEKPILGWTGWMEEMTGQKSADARYDCAVVATWRDIHDESWCSFLKFGLMGTKSIVDNAWTSRTLKPEELRVLRARHEEARSS
jgi:hypothetical protein